MIELTSAAIGTWIGTVYPGISPPVGGSVGELSTVPDAVTAVTAATAAVPPTTAVTTATTAVPPTTAVPTEYAPTIQTAHIAVALLLTLLLWGLGLWILRTRQTRGARMFAAAVLVTGVRTASDVAHGVIGDVWELLGWLAATNLLFELAIGLLFLRFSARYVGRRWLLGREATAAIVGVWLLAAIVVVTDPLHGATFHRFVLLDAPFAHVGIEHGPLADGILVLAGGSLLAGAGLLAHSFTVTERPSWWAAWLLSIGIALALLIAGLGTFGYGPLSQFSYNGVALGVFLLLASVPLLSHGLRRIEITAREAILEDVEDAIVILDDAKAVVDYNRAAAQVFSTIDPGHSFEDVVAEPIEFPDPGSVVRVERSLRELHAPTNGPDDAIDETGSPAQSEPADGAGASNGSSGYRSTEDRHYLVQVAPVAAITGDNIGYTVRFADITDLRRRAEELRRKNEQLDQFAATVSDDLRAPLAVAEESVEHVEAAIAAAETAGADVQTLSTYVGQVEGSFERMSVIIDDILAMAQSTDPVAEVETVRFREVVADAWSAVDTKDATISGRSDGTIEADPDRLQRILENLFRNALDHVGPDVDLTVALTDDGFTVADDGPGIPADVGEQIFEQGYTTGGTGLGLSIVTDLADAHGWTVGLDDEHDGAKFVVTGAETEVELAASDAS